MNNASLFSKEDATKINSQVLLRYARVAQGEGGKLFRYPIGRAGLDGLGYDKATTALLPDDIASTFCGVSNVFSAAPVAPGAGVLDIGCGAGVDTIIAARMAGPAGKAAGIDLTPGMIALAQDNAKRAGASNVSFMQASAESLPFPDGSFHLVTSNGVFNLVIDKEKALAEAWRVLRPGGRLAIADQTLADESPRGVDTMTRNWGR